MEIEISDTMIISKVLATLSEEYAHFASACDSTEITGKTLENLTARLIAEEMRIGARNKKEKGVAFRAAGFKKSKKCFKCNKFGHIAKDCKIKSNQGGKQIRCFKCNKTGHVEKFCKEKQQLKLGESCSIKSVVKNLIILINHAISETIKIRRLKKKKKYRF